MAILRFKNSSNTWAVAGDGVGGGSIDRTVILPAANWSNSAPYTQTVAMSEILGTDAPIVSLDLSGVSSDEIATYQKEYNYINRVNTVDGQITAYCYNSKPTKDLTLCFKVIFNTISRLLGGGSTDTSSFPQFTYTGESQLIDDGDNNWRIKFFTSGVLNFTSLKQRSLDVFCLGGGGSPSDSGYTALGGGGGGYTTTQKGVVAATNTDYQIVVGAGGTAAGVAGGLSSAFGTVANGGRATVDKTTNSYGGCDGGSGGGAANYSGNYPAGDGGSDGNDGGDGLSSSNSSGYLGKGGTGQGTTTREFGEANGTLYAGGGAGKNGGGGGGTPGVDGSAGAGGGASQLVAAPANYGGGGSQAFPIGGSGIVVIRNSRS